MTDSIIEVFIAFIIIVALILVVRVYLKKFTRKSTCPNCNAKDYKRVSRDPFTKFILFFMDVQTLKCLKCSYKFNLQLKKRKVGL